jgi:hypothetical protein
MKKQYRTALVTFLVLFLVALNGRAQGSPPLKLVQKIPMPGVQGRTDHLTDRLINNQEF